MDTVQIDISKLQLLNDRINQTLEALGQVRTSVHGLQHSSAVGYDPAAIAGLSSCMSPLGVQQQVPTFAGMNPFAGTLSMAGVPTIAGNQALRGSLPVGFNHSAPEALEIARWSDPVWVARCAQAFPFLTSQVAPVMGQVAPIV